jgi:hypothetical protein
MMFVLKVRFLKSRIGDIFYRRWMARRGHPRRTPDEYIRRFAPGKSFLDIGGMWGINGGHSFAAEQAGATRVVCVDLNKTPEFDERKERSASKVEFVAGDATTPEIRTRLGKSEVVWCFGVLYHLPDPLAFMRALGTLCSETLLLETFTIPEIRGAPQAAVYFPMLDPRSRRLWNTLKRGSAAVQYGITVDYDPSVGYANNFWGMSPSCVRALLETAGFRVHDIAPSPNGVFRHVFVCTAV